MKKYPFDTRELEWAKLYEENDTLIFSSGADTDTLIIDGKKYRTPRNLFWFDWEGENVIEVTDEIPAVVTYYFIVKHNTDTLNGYIEIKKAPSFGLEFFMVSEGRVSMHDLKRKNYGDTVSLNLEKNSRMFNYDNTKYHDSVRTCRLIPSQGFIEYTVEDGTTYKLIEHKRAKIGVDE